MTTNLKENKKSNVNFDNIPDGLKKQKIWSFWNYEGRHSDIFVPTPKTIINESINVRTRKGLITFEVCKKHAHKFDGIGIPITHGDPFMIWRIDDCCDMESGFIDDNATKILDRLDSYSEYTINGKGLNIIVKPEIPFFIYILGIPKFTIPNGDEVREMPFEFQNLSVSNQEQFLPITGNQVPGTPKVVHARKEVCEKLFEDIPPAVVLREFDTVKKSFSMLSDNYLTYIFYLLRWKKRENQTS